MSQRKPSTASEDVIATKRTLKRPGGAGEDEDDEPKYLARTKGAGEKIFLNLASAGCFGDERLLPSVFQELAVTFHTSLTQLGFLALIGSIFSSLAYPVAGAFGDAYYRGRIILGALVGIAATTLLMAISASYSWLIVFKALNGISIGMLVPPLQSLVGDLHAPGRRGQAFGHLNFTGITGSICGSALAMILAAHMYWGIDGWRIALLIWVLFLTVIIIGLWFLALPGMDWIDRHKEAGLEEVRHKALGDQIWQALVDSYERAVYVLSIPTLQILIIPQAIGGIPWMAMTGWVAFYLEALGFSNTAAAILILVTGAGFACGSFLGGLLGDLAEKWDRDKGRIMVAQITILIGVCAFFFDLRVLPSLCHGIDSLSAGLVYAVCLFMTGIITIGGSGAACNLPIIMACLPSSYRTSGVAMERFFGSIVAAFGPALVGVIAEYYFGYSMDTDTASDGMPAIDLDDGNSTSTDEVVAPHEELFLPLDSPKARVLGDSLALVGVVAWLVACSMWTVLYFTYPTDRLAENPDEEIGAMSGGGGGGGAYGTGTGALSTCSVAGTSNPASYDSDGASQEGFPEQDDKDKDTADAV